MIQMSRFLPRLRARAPRSRDHGTGPGAARRSAGPCLSDNRFITEHDREPDYDVFVPSMQLPAALAVADLEPRNITSISEPYASHLAPRREKRPKPGSASVGADILVSSISPARSRSIFLPVFYRYPRRRFRRLAEQPHGRGRAHPGWHGPGRDPPDPTIFWISPLRSGPAISWSRSIPRSRTSPRPAACPCCCCRAPMPAGAGASRRLALVRGGRGSASRRRYGLAEGPGRSGGAHRPPWGRTDAGERRFVTALEDRSVADGPWRVADHLRILAFGPSADEAAGAAASCGGGGRERPALTVWRMAPLWQRSSRGLWLTRDGCRCGPSRPRCRQQGRGIGSGRVAAGRRHRSDAARHDTAVRGHRVRSSRLGALPDVTYTTLPDLRCLYIKGSILAAFRRIVAEMADRMRLAPILRRAFFCSTGSGSGSGSPITRW